MWNQSNISKEYSYYMQHEKFLKTETPIICLSQTEQSMIFLRRKSIQVLNLSSKNVCLLTMLSVVTKCLWSLTHKPMPYQIHPIHTLYSSGNERWTSPPLPPPHTHTHFTLWLPYCASNWLEAIRLLLVKLIEISRKSKWVFRTSAAQVQFYVHSLLTATLGAPRVSLFTDE